MEFVFLLSLAFRSQGALQTVLCTTSFRPSQGIDGNSHNLCESITCLGKIKRDPREALASVTGTLEKEESTECCVGFDLRGFCSHSVWVNLLVPNRAGSF